MQTDPISAAHAYRQALQSVLKATTLQEARKLASAAVAITFARAEGGQISVESGFGGNSQQPFVTLGIANPTESANPVVQLVSSQARQIALQILEAADAADADGFLVTFAREQLGTSMEQAAQLLNEFRAYRERLRGAQGEST